MFVVHRCVGVLYMQGVCFGYVWMTVGKLSNNYASFAFASVWVVVDMEWVFGPQIKTGSEG